MAKAPGTLTPAAAEAHQRLAAALAGLEDELTICHDDRRFMSEDADERAQAARVCRGCPIFAACAAAGEHEAWGIWAGVDREPLRGPRRAAQ